MTYFFGGNQFASGWMPFSMAATAGLVQGVTAVNKVGDSSDVDTAEVPAFLSSVTGLETLNAIDHTKVYTIQSPVSLELVSDSAADSSAGAGLRRVIIQYLDSAYVSKTIILATNGLTPVALPESVMAINNFVRDTSAGASGTFGAANSGNISIRATGGAGRTYCYMRAGEGIMRSSHLTVPAGSTFLLMDVTYSINKGTGSTVYADIGTRSMSPTGVLLKPSITSVSSEQVFRAAHHNFVLGVVPEKYSIWQEVDTCSASNASITGIMYGLLIPNKHLSAVTFPF